MSVCEICKEEDPSVHWRRDSTGLKRQVCKGCWTDPVAHPSHYTFGAIEVIDAIEAWDLGFHLGNVVKYVARAGKKDKTKEIEDLEKAQWYLNRKIEKLAGR